MISKQLTSRDCLKQKSCILDISLLILNYLIINKLILVNYIKQIESILNKIVNDHDYI